MWWLSESRRRYSQECDGWGRVEEDRFKYAMVEWEKKKIPVGSGMQGWEFAHLFIAYLLICSNSLGQMSKCAQFAHVV